MAAGQEHVIDCATTTCRPTASREADFARTTFSARDRARRAAAAGQVHRLRLVGAALDAGAARPGLGGAGRGQAHRLGRPACASSASTWTSSGSAADVEIDGEPRLQQALRFGMFHVLQAGARSEGRAIPAKGLTGSGYDGHAFWDTETFVLPMLIYSMPGAARDALRWRHSTLRARRSIAPSSSASRAPRFRGGRSRARNARATGRRAPPPSTSTRTSPTPCRATCTRPADEGFLDECGGELLVATARLWRSLGHHDSSGNFRIDGVTGPDEYSAVADNNVYTNLCAQRNLLRRGRVRWSTSPSSPTRSASTPRRRPRGATPPTR